MKTTWLLPLFLSKAHGFLVGERGIHTVVSGGSKRLAHSVNHGDLANAKGGGGPSQSISDRRAWLQHTGMILAGIATTATIPNAEASSPAPKILVLGGTGFVGQRIVRILRDELGVEVTATSTNGRDGTEAFDVTSSTDIRGDLERLAKGCTAVISTIGAIGTDEDGKINAGSGEAARGAKLANVERFVYISVAPEVVSMAQDIDFLKPYMTGKLQSEATIRSEFPNSFTLIEPTFIYGGDEFKINPPRVAGFYGSFIESLLSSSPLRALTNLAPEGIIKIALEPPVSVDTVAKAAIASALGQTSVSTLDTYDKIRNAATKL